MKNIIEEIQEALEYLSHKKVEHFKPFIENNILLVLGECTGIAVKGSLFFYLVEDDGYWYIDSEAGISNTWLEEHILCCKEALNYLKENGTPYTWADTDRIAGYIL